MGVAPSSALVAGAYAGSFPSTRFPEAHSALTGALLSWRVADYTRSGNGWYLVDVCYFLHGLSLYYMYRASPEERRFLRRPMHLLANGWCLFGVAAWRNAADLGNVGRATSFHLHWSIALLSYWLRWRGETRERFPVAAKGREGGLRDACAMLGGGMGVWLLFVGLHRLVGATGDTSFSYMVRRYGWEAAQRAGFLPRLALYTSISYGYGVATALLARPTYDSQPLHGLLLAAALALGVRNAL